MATNNIVLVHGLWMTPLSFEFWAHHYGERGYRVHVPGWPGMDHDIRRLRRSPESYASLGIRQIVDHYEQVVLGLAEPPILVGHGLGGLVVQALLDRGLGSCGVAVASAPIRGIWTLPYTKMRVVTPQLLATRFTGRCVQLTAAQFHHTFMSNASRDEAYRAYERYVVPGPGRVLLQAGLANLNPFADTAINVRRNSRAPLLMVAASHDLLSPPSMVRANVRAYRDSIATTEYQEFPGRAHFIIAQSGWQEVADYALDWARDQQLLQQREARRFVRELHARQVAVAKWGQTPIASKWGLTPFRISEAFEPAAQLRQADDVDQHVREHQRPQLPRA
jgi:pimeloyl-ACP methyl ester carboxylesterase